jgi:hypothetical protein
VLGDLPSIRSRLRPASGDVAATLELWNAEHGGVLVRDVTRCRDGDEACDAEDREGPGPPMPRLPVGAIDKSGHSARALDQVARHAPPDD